MHARARAKIFPEFFRCQDQGVVGVVRARANFSAPRARLPLRATEFLPDCLPRRARARMVDEAGVRPR